MMTVWDLADSAGNLRTRDVALIVGVHRQTVYKYVACDLLPCRRLPVSGHLVFAAVDVEHFLSGMEPCRNQSKPVET